MFVVQVTSLHKEQYSTFVLPTLYVSLVVAIVCVVMYGVLTLLPLRKDAHLPMTNINSVDPSAFEALKEHQPESSNTHTDTRPVPRVLLVGSIAVLWLLLVLSWTSLVSMNHRNAVDDLMVQLANSTDTVLQSSLVDAKKMVQQATTTWQLSGAPVSDLTSTSVWATDLLEDFQFSGHLGALRFATTSGLEQSVNSTFVNGSFAGIRIISREFYGGSSDVCLKEYLTGQCMLSGLWYRAPLTYHRVPLSE